MPFSFWFKFCVWVPMLHNTSHFISATISMPVLIYVVENIGKYWISLSLNLGVHTAVLDNIEATCQTIPQRALAVLHEWYQRDPENTNKQVLIGALRKIPRNDIADTINVMEWQHKMYSIFRVNLLCFVSRSYEQSLVDVRRERCA